MPSTPNESPIKMTPALEEKVRNATSAQEVTAIMQDAMIEQHLAQRDPWANEVLIPVEPGTAPRQLGRTITVNGVKHIITSDAKDGELGLERAITDFFRQLQQEDANGTRTDSGGTIKVDSQRKQKRKRMPQKPLPMWKGSNSN